MKAHMCKPFYKGNMNDFECMNLGEGRPSEEMSRLWNEIMHEW
jgi:hypothetical protein